MATQKSNLKVAIVTDFFYTYRGSERLIDAFFELFPNSELFALVGDRNLSQLMPNYRGNKINFSVLNKLPFVSKYYRFTYPLWPLLIEQLDFKDFDLIISISSSVAKGVLVPNNAIHISYINSPMRYAWDLKDKYFSKYPKVLRFLIDIFLHYIRIWDVIRNNQIDYVIANSNFVKHRIEKYYGLKVDQVIHPFFDRMDFEKGNSVGVYYLYHGALEPNKGVLEVVKSAAKYGFPLIVSGSGSLKKQIEKLSKNSKNIKILGWVTDREKYNLFLNAKAFIFPSIEDFGIVALESLSVGTPVIALKESGTSEILTEKCGILINSQDIDEIHNGILKLQKINFVKTELIKQSEKYSRDRFLKEIELVVRRLAF